MRGIKWARGLAALVLAACVCVLTAGCGSDGGKTIKKTSKQTESGKASGTESPKTPYDGSGPQKKAPEATKTGSSGGGLSSGGLDADGDLDLDAGLDDGGAPKKKEEGEILGN